MKVCALASAFVGGVALAAPALAQRGALPLRGIVFDSLRGQPMRDAFVSIAGGTQVITTDARGRFQFDSVAAGPHEIMAQHPILDSIGLSGLSAHAIVSDRTGEVRLAVPSFATLWRAACGTSAVPKDKGIVYGTIRDARGTPVANAAVDLVWFDLVLDQTRHVRQRRSHLETRSNESGGYAACGVAAEASVEIRATVDKRETGSIELPPLTTRVQRRDLLLGAAPAGADSETGTVSGTALDPSGRPVADALVFIDSLTEVRTADDGSFTVRRVPTGTRQVRVLLVGAAPVAVPVDVLPGTTASINVTMHRVTALAPMETRAERNVRVFAAEFNERRRRGFGYYSDSTEIVRYDEFVNVLRSMPSMNVQYRPPNLTLTMPSAVGRPCTPRVLIDGTEAGFGHLIDLAPKEVAAVEVYMRSAYVPARFSPIGIQPECGAVLVWTKYGMRNR